MVGAGGVALGLLVASTISTTGPGDVTLTLPPAPIASSTTNPSSSEIEDISPSLEELVPGFEGTLYFIDWVSLDTNDKYLVTWSSKQSAPLPTVERPDYLVLDVTGSRMALPAGITLDTLFPGNTIAIFRNLDNARPLPSDPDGHVGSAVAGFIWHASRPGLLVWIEVDSSYRSTVKTVDLSNPNVLVESSVLAEFDYLAWPRYWDDDLFVMATLSQSLDIIDGQAVTGSFEVQTFDSDWELLGSTLGDLVGRLSTGELVIGEWSGESQQIRSSTFLMDYTLTERLSPDWLPEGGQLTSVVPTPDGSRTWLHGVNEDGRTFLGRMDGPTLVQCVDSPASEQVFRSVDGDWIVYQSIDEARESALWFVNAVTCREFRVDLPDGVGYLAAVGR